MELQLGHAGEGVEMMMATAPTSVRPKLQLGHAGEGVEMASLWAFSLARVRFNWATPVKAWRSRFARIRFQT